MGRLSLKSARTSSLCCAEGDDAVLGRANVGELKENIIGAAQLDLLPGMDALHRGDLLAAGAPAVDVDVDIGVVRHGDIAGSIQAAGRPLFTAQQTRAEQQEQRKRERDYPPGFSCLLPPFIDAAAPLQLF